MPVLTKEALPKLNETQKKHYDILETSLLFYMRKPDMFLAFPEALQQFIALYKANKATPTIEAENLYLKDLLSASPDQLVFDHLIERSLDTMNNKFYFDNLQDMYRGLTTLKFKEAEIFRKLAHGGNDMRTNIKNGWDPAKVYLSRIAGTMAAEQIPFELAMVKTMVEVRASKEMYINRLDAWTLKMFLSEEALVDMYQHARARLTLWVNTWRKKNDEEDHTLRKIAEFTSAHQKNKMDTTYLDADYGLRDLGLAPADCLKLLEENSSFEQISKLNATIGVVKEKLPAIKVLVSGAPAGAKFDEISAPAFVNSVIGVDLFKQLMSYANKVELGLIPPVVSSTAELAVSTKPSLEYLQSITRQAAELNEAAAVALPSSSTAAMPFMQPQAVELTPVHSPVADNALQGHDRYLSTMSSTSFALYAQSTAALLISLGVVLAIVFKPRIVTSPISNCYNWALTTFGKQKLKIDAVENGDDCEIQPLVTARK